MEVHLWVWAPAVQAEQELPLGQAQLAKKSMLAPRAREERIRVIWLLVGWFGWFGEVGPGGTG